MEIKQLIDRYMNGQTTVDEEQLLARYFRSATDLPDDLQPYRDMFAYFDEGMPVGEVSEFDGLAEQTDAAVDSGNRVVPAPRRRRFRIAAIWSGAVAVAAAVALLLVVHHPSAPIPQLMSAVIQKDTTRVVTDEEVERSMVNDSVKVKPQKQRRRSSVRRRYYIAPPKTYLAQTATADSTAHSTNVSKNSSSEDCLVAINQLPEEERLSIERDIMESLKLVDEVRNTLLAVDMLDELIEESTDEITVDSTNECY